VKSFERAKLSRDDERRFAPFEPRTAGPRDSRERSERDGSRDAERLSSCGKSPIFQQLERRAKRVFRWSSAPRAFWLLLSSFVPASHPQNYPLTTQEQVPSQWETESRTRYPLKRPSRMDLNRQTARVAFATVQRGRRVIYPHDTTLVIRVCRFKETARNVDKPYKTFCTRIDEFERNRTSGRVYLPSSLTNRVQCSPTDPC